MLKYGVSNGILTISLEGHIDSLNASEVEEAIREIRAGKEEIPVILDSSMELSDEQVDAALKAYFAALPDKPRAFAHCPAQKSRLSGIL